MTQTRNTVTRTFSLPPDLAAALRETAEEEGLSESLIVRWALERMLTASKRQLPFKPHTKRTTK